MADNAHLFHEFYFSANEAKQSFLNKVFLVGGIFSKTSWNWETEQLSGQFNKLSYIICLSSDIIHFVVCSWWESLTLSKNSFIEKFYKPSHHQQPPLNWSLHRKISNWSLHQKPLCQKPKSIKMIDCQLVVKTTYGIYWLLEIKLRYEYIVKNTLGKIT